MPKTIDDLRIALRRAEEAEARVAALEANELIRWMDSKPDPGRHFALYERWDDEPMLVQHYIYSDGTTEYKVSRNGLCSYDGTIDSDIDRPISDQCLWQYVAKPPNWGNDYLDGVPTWRGEGD